MCGIYLDLIVISNMLISVLQKVWIIASLFFAVLATEKLPSTR